MRHRFVERWAENDSQTYLDTLAAVSGWSVRDRLAEITCKTCVISAENDFFPISLKREYLTANPNAELVIIPDSGHFTPIDQKDRFNSAVLAFLEKMSGVRKMVPGSF